MLYLHLFRVFSSSPIFALFLLSYASLLILKLEFLNFGVLLYFNKSRIEATLIHLIATTLIFVSFYQFK